MPALIEPLRPVVAPGVLHVLRRRGGVIDSRHVAVRLLRLPVCGHEGLSELLARRLFVEDPKLVLRRGRHILAREDREMPTHVGLCDLKEDKRFELF